MKELSLPVMAFNLKGYDEYITLYIDEIFGYPDETSYGGGYGAKGRIEIAVGGYRVDSIHYFTTGELFQFKESLKKCYEKLEGTANLDNTEHELEVTVSFDKTGKVKINGWFSERPDLDNELTFDIGSDQTNILPVIEQLETVEKVFGNMKGI